MTRTIAWACLLVMSSAAVGFAEERTWTDTTGRSMKAEFLRKEGTNVVFRKEGKEVTVPISRLSPQDRDVVTALSEQEGGDNPFEAVAEDKRFEVVADEKDSSASSSSDAAEKPRRIVQRMWTDAQGKQVKAKFVRINGQNVVLNRSGRILSVPYNNLSQEDQEYVAELLKERGEEDTVPPPIARGNSGNDTSGSPLGGGSGGPPGMSGASGSFPGGMAGGGFPGGGVAGTGSLGSMPTLPSPPSGMAGGSAGGYPGLLPPGGRGYPGSTPPGGFPGSLPNPGVRGGYPGSMPSMGGYPGGALGSSYPGSAPPSLPGMARGSSPSMGPGSSFPGSSSPSYPSTLGGPYGGSSMMGSGSSGMSGPPGMAGTGWRPSLPELPRVEFIYECSQCKKKFVESESKGKTHCPNCGVAWLNQGGTAGTFDKSAPQYSSHWSGLQTFWGTRGIVRLVVLAIVFLGALLGGGATAVSRWRKS